MKEENKELIEANDHLRKQRDIGRLGTISVIVMIVASLIAIYTGWVSEICPREGIQLGTENITICTSKDYCPYPNYGYEVDGYYELIFNLYISNYGKRTAVIDYVDLIFYDKSGDPLFSKQVKNQNLVSSAQNPTRYFIAFTSPVNLPPFNVRCDYPVNAKITCVSKASQNEDMLEKIEVRVHSLSRSRYTSKFVYLKYPSNSTNSV